MIESKIIQAITAGTGTPAYGVTPAHTLPDGLTYYRVEKTGGSVTEKALWRATIAIQSYAPTLAECITLNDSVIDFMLNTFIRQNYVAKVTLNSDYNYTDPTDNRPRYQAVFEIIYYKGE